MLRHLPGDYFGVPDIAYCAGLKLIAPPTLTGVYQSTQRKLDGEIQKFLSTYQVKADFHLLELLSTSYQMIFTDEFIIKHKQYPSNTRFMGPLPISVERDNHLSFSTCDKPVVLCFGSALDPANYPEILHPLIKITARMGRRLIIASRLPDHIPALDHIIVAPYLPLPALIQRAAIFIHHGGANTFSEALTLGATQILIPLTTDQPIQAEILRELQAGIVIYPQEISEETLTLAFLRILDRRNPLHKQIRHIQKIFAKRNGAEEAANLIEMTKRTC